MPSEGYKPNGAIVVTDALGTKNKDVKNDYGKIGNPFVEYKIKLKNSFEYKYWITNWSKILKENYNDMINNNSPKIELHKYLINKFSKNTSINDFEKIQNSIDFIKEITKQ